MRTFLFVTALLLAGRPTQLHAQNLITFRFHGVVTEIKIDEGPAPPGVVVGSSFDGSYSFDPALPDSATYSDRLGRYVTRPSLLQVTIEGLHWQADGLAIAIDDYWSLDVYSANYFPVYLNGPPELAAMLDLWQFELHLESDGTIISDDRLLTAPPEPSQWSKTRLRLIGMSTWYGYSDPLFPVDIFGSLTDLELAGDFDGNGHVDSTDLTSWQANFGTSGSVTHSQGDANGDHTVDGADFLLWQRQLAATSAASITTPEPASCSMVAALLVVVVLNCRQRGALVDETR